MLSRKELSDNLNIIEGLYTIEESHTVDSKIMIDTVFLKPNLSKVVNEQEYLTGLQKEFFLNF